MLQPPALSPQGEWGPKPESTDWGLVSASSAKHPPTGGSLPTGFLQPWCKEESEDGSPKGLLPGESASLSPRESLHGNFQKGSQALDR